ncbi:MAG: HEPN domain-containing protein [Methanosarcinales archaeon]
MNNNQREFELWFDQAKYDLHAAEGSIDHGDYEWACFQAQQSAEKALKAFLFLKGERAIITHSVYRLIKMCLNYDSEFKTIINAKELDEYYIPTRYPNGLPDEVPHRFYNLEDAEKCVNYAKSVISMIERLGRQ